MPLISVIVPVYKVEPYLRRCVDSILAQTFQDFEIILVDDGSPDNCGAICDEYAAKDARIHVIHQANGGLSAARNAGIDWAFTNSDSRWLAFVDSDDWVHPQYLELLYQAAIENDVQVSVCKFLRVEAPSEAVPVSCTSNEVTWEQLLLTDNLTGVLAWNKLYEKPLFEKLRYPAGKYHEDEYLTYKLLYLAQRLAYVPAELYYYYQNPDGIMKRTFNLKHLDKFPALEDRLNFTRQHGCRQLFQYDLRRYLRFCAYDHERLKNAESIPDSIRVQELRRLRQCAREMIFRYGLFCLPLRKNKSYYSFAFPGLGKAAKPIYLYLKHVFGRTSG